MSVFFVFGNWKAMLFVKEATAYFESNHSQSECAGEVGSCENLKSGPKAGAALTHVYVECF